MAKQTHSGVFAAVRRVRLMAGCTMGEGVRLRLTGLLVVVAGLLLFGVRWLREFNFGATELAFIGDFGLGVIGLMGTALAAFGTAHLFFNDLANGAAACVLTRPVRRWEYLTGKLAGVAGLLALFTAILGALLGAVMMWRAHQLGASAAALSVLLSACALQWMKFTLVAALTLCVCAYASTALFAGCAGLLLAAIGHLRAFASGTMEWLRFWPNLAQFDAEGVLAGGQSPAGSMSLALGVYWAVCLLLACGLAAYVFKHREF